MTEMKQLKSEKILAPIPPCSYLVDSMLGLYWDNGKENGNYYIIMGYTWGYIPTNLPACQEDVHKLEAMATGSGTLRPTAKGRKTCNIGA